MQAKYRKQISELRYQVDNLKRQVDNMRKTQSKIGREHLLSWHPDSLQRLRGMKKRPGLREIVNMLLDHLDLEFKEAATKSTLVKKGTNDESSQ